MTKKILFPLVFALALVLAGCGQGPATTGTDNAKADTGSTKSDTGGVKTNAGNGDSALDDMCTYFPKELIEAAIGKPILKVEKPFVTGNACFFYTIYTDTYDHTPSGDVPGGAPVVVTLRTEDLAADIAAKEKTGSVFKKDAGIPMDNYVAYDNTKRPWQVMLILNDKQYFELHYVHSAVTGDELVKIAIKLAQRVQNGD
jgi:hypothetical protein